MNKRGDYCKLLTNVVIEETGDLVNKRIAKLLVAHSNHG